MTAPHPAALLAAMEAAAQDYREQCLPEITLLTDDLAALCAALRASQEREAAAVAARDALEGLRPLWAQGWSSDSIAAQTAAGALSQVWKVLGAVNQTDAMDKLRTLAARKDAAP